MTAKAAASRRTPKLGPVEGALFINPDIANEEYAEKDKHGDERKGPPVRHNPRAIKKRPRKQEHGFHVEDHEKHGDDIKARGVAAPGVAFRGNTAFVGLKFERATAGFGANQFKYKKSEIGKRENE